MGVGVERTALFGRIGLPICFCARGVTSVVQHRLPGHLSPSSLSPGAGVCGFYLHSAPGDRSAWFLVPVGDSVRWTSQFPTGTCCACLAGPGGCGRLPAEAFCCARGVVQRASVISTPTSPGRLMDAIRRCGVWEIWGLPASGQGALACFFCLFLCSLSRVPREESRPRSSPAFTPRCPA